MEKCKMILISNQSLILLTFYSKPNINFLNISVENQLRDTRDSAEAEEAVRQVILLLFQIKCFLTK